MNLIQIKPGMRFTFMEKMIMPLPQVSPTMTVLAIPTGWLVQTYRCNPQKINPVINDETYQVPDKDHVINPCSFWSPTIWGQFERSTPDVPGVETHQLVAEWLFDHSDRDPIIFDETSLYRGQGKIAAEGLRNKEPRQAVELGLAPSFDENILLCPACGGDFLHHRSLDWYHSIQEDSKELIANHIDDNGVIATRTVKRGKSRNPSDRRGGLLVFFSCETCSAVPVLSVAQHKGQTIVKWEEY